MSRTKLFVRGLPTLLASLRSGLLASGMLGGAVLFTGPALAETTLRLSHSHDRFCAEVQQLLVPTGLDIVNRVEPDFDSFKRSKPEANPLTLHQFLSPAQSNGLRQLSCKTKSADHLRAVYGTATAAAPPSALQPSRSCRDVHRAMVKAIWREMDAVEREAARYPPHRVMLDADLAYLTGSSWIQSPAQAYVGAEQRLHLRAVRLFAGWEDWRWKVLPESLRGNHYCHLIAPESLRDVMRHGMAEDALDP